MPQPTVVEVVEREFPKARRLLDKWSQHIFENVIDFGWNVCIDRPDSAGVRGNTEYSNTVEQEVWRLRMRPNLEHQEAVDAHTSWRLLPRPWRRAFWAIYIEGARAGSTLALCMGIKAAEVPSHLRLAYAEFLDKLPSAVSTRAA